jgi:hypothetical protein
MAKAAKSPKKGSSANGGESVSGYFRRIILENPKLLKKRSNDELLERWQADHPGEELNASVKGGLANLKSVMRSKLRRRGRQKAQAESPSPEAPAPKIPVARLEALEAAIDECLAMARAADAEGLAASIRGLRHARNLVVYQLGTPG